MATNLNDNDIKSTGNNYKVNANNGVTSNSHFNTPFNPCYVDTWLLQFEVFLALNSYDLNSREARLILIQSLPTNILAQAGDELTNLTRDTNFMEWKSAIKRTCGISADKALDKILGPITESTQPPRTIYNNLVNAIATGLPESTKETKERIATTRFIASLPTHQREVISVIADEGPEKILAIAEKLHHISLSQPSAHINYISTEKENSNKRLQQLEEKVDLLQKTVENLLRHQPQNSYRQRSRSRDNFQLDPSSKKCYYHQKFGNNATKCTCNHLNQ